jgi:hypothetical protein
VLSVRWGLVTSDHTFCELYRLWWWDGDDPMTVVFLSVSSGRNDLGRGQATVFSSQFTFALSLYRLTYICTVTMYKQLLATDLLVLATMKNAAKCDK